MTPYQPSNAYTDIETFIYDHQLDDASAEILRNEDPEIQNAVMAPGKLLGTNPSAIVMGRLKQAHQARRGGASSNSGGGGQDPMQTMSSMVQKMADQGIDDRK